MAKFHQDVSRDDENEISWDQNPSRNLSVLTSCPDIFTWIHRKFAELLLELHLSQSCPDELPETIVSNTGFHPETFWSLRKIFKALSDRTVFQETVYQFLSGTNAVCVESVSNQDGADIFSCFNALLPQPVNVLAKNDADGLWHYCIREGLKDCQKLLKVRLVDETRFDVSGPVNPDSQSSQLVRQICDVVSKDRVSWQVCLVQLHALNERWISQARIWAATRLSSETLQKEFLKIRNLKQSDVKILDYWTSFVK